MIRICSKRTGMSGMTLVEMLVVITILSVAGTAVFGTVTAGMKLWARGLRMENEQDARILLDKMTADLRKLTPFSQIKFEGGSDSLFFPAVTRGNHFMPGSLSQYYPNVRQVEKIGFFYDIAKKAVIYQERTYDEVMRKKQGRIRRVLNNVQSMTLYYYSHYSYDDKLSEKFFLKDGTIPKFIKVEIVYLNNLSEQKKVTELIDIPMGRSIAW